MGFSGREFQMANGRRLEVTSVFTAVEFIGEPHFLKKTNVPRAIFDELFHDFIL